MSKIIYKAIRDRIRANPTHLTDAGHKVPELIAIYNKQYIDEDKEALPARPLLYVEFGRSDKKVVEGVKEGEVPVIVHIVQDLRVTGSDKSLTEDDYLKLLDYPELIDDILYKAPVGNYVLEPSDEEPDHDHDSLLVNKLQFKVMVKRSVGMG